MPQSLGHLNRAGTDATRAGVNQQGFRWLIQAQLRALKHIEPNREQGFGQARRLRHRPAVWYRQTLTRIRPNVFGIAAPMCQRTHAITDFPRRIAFDLNHFTRHLQPEQRRRILRRRIQTTALQHIGTIDPRRMHANQHLLR